jgi:hypothetical protein
MQRKDYLQQFHLQRRVLNTGTLMHVYIRFSATTVQTTCEIYRRTTPPLRSPLEIQNPQEKKVSKYFHWNCTKKHLAQVTMLQHTMCLVHRNICPLRCDIQVFVWRFIVGCVYRAVTIIRRIPVSRRKPLLASPCLSVHLFQNGFHWTDFCENWLRYFYGNPLEKSEVS